MKITPNHISILLSREGSSVLAFAERKNAEQWTLQKQNEDRKDTFTEAVLQRSIDKGDLKVKHFQLKPEIINMAVDIDTSDAVGQLAELEEQMEKTAIAGRAMLVVLAALDSSFAGDAALAARIDALESATVNLNAHNSEGLNVSVIIEEPISDGLRAVPRQYSADDFRFAKSVEIDGKMWSRDTIGDAFYCGGSGKPVTGIVKAVNGASNVQITGFPAIDIYDYLTVKYSSVCADVRELSQEVSKIEAHLAETRKKYNEACDLREQVYTELQKVHGQL